MGKGECMLLVVLAAIVLHCAAAEKHVVGGDIGWTVPKGGASAYSTWASGKKFNVGDFLVFNFKTSSHDVIEVSKAHFDSCTSSSPIGKPSINGPTEIELTSGEHYYICTVGKHCQFGQKVAVNVGSSAASSPSKAPSSAVGTPPTTTGSKATTPPSYSSSTVVFTSCFVTFFSIAMGLFL